MSELHGVTDINGNAERLAEEERLRRVREDANTSYNVHSNSSDIGIGLLNAFNSVAEIMVEKEQQTHFDNVKSLFAKEEQYSALQEQLREQERIEKLNAQKIELEAQAQTYRDNIIASEKGGIDCGEKKIELEKLYGAIHSLDNAMNDNNKGNLFYSFNNQEDAQNFSQAMSGFNCVLEQQGDKYYARVEQGIIDAKTGQFECEKVASSFFKNNQCECEVLNTNFEDKYAVKDEYGKISIDESAKSRQLASDLNFMGGTISGMVASMEGFNELKHISDAITNVSKSIAKIGQTMDNAEKYGVAVSDGVGDKLNSLGLAIGSDGKVTASQGVQDLSAISGALMSSIQEKNGSNAIENWNHSKALQKLEKEYVGICQKCPNLPRDKKGNIDTQALSKLNEKQLANLNLTLKEREVLVKVGDYAKAQKLLEKSGLALKVSQVQSGFNFMMKNTLAGAYLGFSLGSALKISAKAMSSDEDTAQLMSFYSRTTRYGQKTGKIISNNYKLIKNKVQNRLNKSNNGLVKKIKDKRDNLRNKRQKASVERNGLKKNNNNFKKKDEGIAKAVKGKLSNNVVTPFGRFKQSYNTLKANMYKKFASTKLGGLVSKISTKLANFSAKGMLKALANLLPAIGEFLLYYLITGLAVCFFIALISIILNFLEGGVTDQVIYKLYESMYEQENQWLANLEGIKSDENGNFELTISAENGEYYLQNPNRFIYDQSYGSKLLDIGRYTEWYFLKDKASAPFLHIYYTGDNTTLGIVQDEDTGHRLDADKTFVTSFVSSDLGSDYISKGSAPQIYIDPFFTPARVTDTHTNGMTTDYFTMWGLMKPVGVGRKIYADYFNGNDILPSITVNGVRTTGDYAGFSIDANFNGSEHLYRDNFGDDNNISRVGKVSEATATREYGDLYIYYYESFGLFTSTSTNLYMMTYKPYEDVESAYNEIKELSNSEYKTIINAMSSGDNSAYNSLSYYQKKYCNMYSCRKNADTFTLHKSNYSKTVNATYPWNDNDVISIVTIYPNFQMATGLSYGGHTSNIKDILCMLDVMMQFDEDDKDDDAPYFKQNLTDSQFIFTLKEWANKVIHTFRLLKVLFDPDYKMYDWNAEFKYVGTSFKTLSTYCSSLFELTHQQFAELSVVYYYTDKTTGLRDFVIYSYGGNEYTRYDESDYDGDGVPDGGIGDTDNSSDANGINDAKKTMVSLIMDECPDYDPDRNNHYDMDDNAIPMYGCHITSGLGFQLDSSLNLGIRYPVVFQSSEWDYRFMDATAQERIARFVPSTYDFTAYSTPDASSFMYGDASGTVKPCFSKDFITTNGYPLRNTDIRLAFEEYTYHKVDDELNSPCWQVTTTVDEETEYYSLNQFSYGTNPSRTLIQCNDGHSRGSGYSLGFSPTLDGIGLPTPNASSSEHKLAYFSKGTNPYTTNYGNCFYQFYYVDEDNNIIQPNEINNNVHLKLNVFYYEGCELTCGQYAGEGKSCDDHCTVSGSHSSHTCNSECFCSHGHLHGIGCYKLKFTHYVYQFDWRCSFNHTIEMCGGHIVLDNYGMVYSFMDEDVDTVEEFIRKMRADEIGYEAEEFEVVGVIGENLDYSSFYNARMGYEEGTTNYDKTGRWGYSTLVMNGGFGDGYNYAWAKYGIPFVYRHAQGLNLMPFIDGSNTWVWYSGDVKSYVGGSIAPESQANKTIFDNDDPIPVSDITVTAIIRSINDIFSADANIEYGLGMFPMSHNNDNYLDYEGWTKDNMYIAMLKYCMSWEDIYDFEITVNQGTIQLGSDTIAQITQQLTETYGEDVMNEERTKAVNFVLQSVGRGNYSSEHREHCYLGKDCDIKFTSFDFQGDDLSHYCSMTDTSSYASWVYGLRSTRGMYVKSCEDFWNLGSEYTEGMTLRPLDILVSYDPSKQEGMEGKNNHCYVYLGQLAEEVSGQGVIIPANVDLWVHCSLKNTTDGNIYLEMGTYPSTSYARNLNTKGYGLGCNDVEGIRMVDIDGNAILYRKVSWLY